ncbi:hypothetical protein PILCRDRAFT_829700 [Piloderma croceum F 1598]|uniref:Uncharacterized protein n=1 Tax=Piloderma croceum (strain F 1598) TaxID=765440 RepID=A0A0C3EIN6_PILCF|nr:hypothetical protein PILCRDRAFT_829700 [Piloderma croceum F 1598]
MMGGGNCASGHIPLFLASESDCDNDLQPANAAFASTSNQGTLSASDTLNSNASAQLASSAPTVTTIRTLGNPLAAAVAMPVAVIENVSESSHLMCQSLFVKGVTVTLTYDHHTTVLTRLTFDHPRIPVTLILLY